MKAKGLQTDRAALQARWDAKVQRKGSYHGCWAWAGAQSKTRNGQRGVIRIGDKSMSARRVGLALATGVPLASEQAKRGGIEHAGRQFVDECINPAHNAWLDAPLGRSRRRATRKK